MAPSSAQPETLTIPNELREAPPAVPERASPQTSARLRSGKKVLRRSVALRPGTPSPECAQRPALSVAAACTRVGHPSPDLSVPCPAPLPTWQSYWTLWSATIQKILLPQEVSTKYPIATQSFCTRTVCKERGS